ncbi:MAG: glycosyltransferase family 4 protein [Patescibacteria group bacterium]
MRLLFFTQALDTDDPILSVYARWVSEFSRHFEFITVVCLKVGEYSLPKNIRAFSLGKESGESRLKYIWNFYYFIFKERKGDDAVFVHMNQEYILLGGLFWKMMGKKIYMWRNHHAGSIFTDIAVAFCTKVFCTSKFSYTAKYKKTAIMPVGIDTGFFVKKPEIAKIPRSILFLSRMAPVKKPHIFIRALALLKNRGISFRASFFGDPLSADERYYNSLKEMVALEGLVELVRFYPGVSNDQTVEIFNEHEIFVNLSPSGMYDKTIFEAMACETMILATNKNLTGLIPESFTAMEDDAENIAMKLEKLLAFSSDEKTKWGSELRRVAVEHHSLRELGNKLATLVS